MLPNMTTIVGTYLDRFWLLYTDEHLNKGKKFYKSLNIINNPCGAKKEYIRSSGQLFRAY